MSAESNNFIIQCLRACLKHEGIDCSGMTDQEIIDAWAENILKPKVNS